MEADKKPVETEAAEPAQASQSAPQDALERTNEELDATAKTEALNNPSSGSADAPKKPNGFKQFLKKFNVYLLLFLLVVAIGVIVSVVSYLNSKKAPVSPTIASQKLTTDTLKQLANSDATVGGGGQTLTVQGNAIFSGQVLIRSDLNVAGTIKVGGEVLIPTLTVSGKTNLNDTQVNGLQVANGSTFQGAVTIQHDLNVGGSTSFNGPVTAGQLTVASLNLSGNATLQVPNHLAFTGPSPSRSSTGPGLGGGGSASVSGSDTAGTINVNTGNNTVPGCFISINFSKPFNSTPRVQLTPVNAAAGQAEYYVTRTTTSFSVCSANAAPSNQAFAYDYFITSSSG